MLSAQPIMLHITRNGYAVTPVCFDSVERERERERESFIYYTLTYSLPSSPPAVLYYMPKVPARDEPP